MENCLLGPPRDKDQRNQAEKHGHGAEGKQLRIRLNIVTWIMDEGRQTQDSLASRQPDEQCHNVGRKAAIGIAMLLEVHHHEQLWEQDDVDQIGAHGPAVTRNQGCSWHLCK